MDQSLQPAFTIQWCGNSYPTYDVALKDFKPGSLNGSQKGVYALDNGAWIEFGRSRRLPQRIAQRKRNALWADRALVLDLTASSEMDLYCFVEIYCIGTAANISNFPRELCNIRCRESMGKFFYPYRSRFYEIAQIWLDALFPYLGIPPTEDYYSLTWGK